MKRRLPTFVAKCCLSLDALATGSNLWPIWLVLLSPIALLYLVILLLVARRREAA